MSNSIGQHFTPWSLLKFAAPSIIMMTFMSLYTIVDGVFISRFVGSNALSSLNIVFPVITLAIAIGTMFSTGGNAVISKYLGEGNPKRACQCLTVADGYSRINQCSPGLYPDCQLQYGYRRSCFRHRYRAMHPGCSRRAVLPVHQERAPLHPLQFLPERNGKGSVQRVFRNGDRAVHCHYNLLI